MSAPSPAPGEAAAGGGGSGSKLLPGSGGGRGRGGRGRGGRGHGNRGAGQIASNAATNKLKGNMAKMNGHVFQCFNETNISNKFAKTVEVLAKYIAKHIKFPDDMASLTEDLTLLTLTAPVILPATADELEKLLWKQDVVQYAQQRAYLASNHKAVYAVIWDSAAQRYEPRSSRTGNTWQRRQTASVAGC
jgi:hypothetical protein